MATVVSQHVRYLDCHPGFFNIFILRKTAATCTEISTKHVFAASKKPMEGDQFDSTRPPPPPRWTFDPLTQIKFIKGY